MAKITPAQFIHEVRQEAAKITWPTRKEALVTTGMVFVMVVAAAFFFLFVDWTLARGVRIIFGLGA